MVLIRYIISYHTRELEKIGLVILGGFFFVLVFVLGCGLLLYYYRIQNGLCSERGWGWVKLDTCVEYGTGVEVLC